MNRCLAFVGALLFAFISVSSACTAAPAGLDPLHARAGTRDGAQDPRQLSRREARPRPRTTGRPAFAPSELVGSRPCRVSWRRHPPASLCHSPRGRPARLRGSAAANPMRPAIAASAPNPRFSQLLDSRGIGRPTDEQAFGLMAVNARRDLIDALAAARYPTPSIDDLMALSALGVSGAYIGEPGACRLSSAVARHR